MCKRKAPTDPLVRRFLKSYGVNLLPLPRRNAVPGELYIKTGPKVKATSGLMSEVIEPDVQLPAAYPEPLPKLKGVASNAVDWEFGLGLAGNFLTTLGVPPGVIDDVKAGYKDSSTARVSFQFDDVTRESIDPFAIGTALIGHRFKQHPWIRDGSKYYVAAGFVLAKSMSLSAQDADTYAVDVGAGVIKLLDAKAKVSVERTGDGTLAYRGTESLAIGVELYELEYDRTDGFRMGGQLEPVDLQRGRDNPWNPSFPADDDEALLYVETEETKGGPQASR
jgi:hypothetical protein